MIAPAPMRSLRKRLKVRMPVTVCVAAMAQYLGNGIIVGASDRMVTSGDIEFEQEQRKIHPLTNAIHIMVAGDLGIQTDLLHEIEAWKDNHLEQFPEIWIKVKDVADEFHGSLVRWKRRAACDAILTPLSLDYERLVSPDISENLAMQLSKEILNFQISPIEAIVMGIDASGSHIYIVDNVSGVTCHDWTGFAAIGGGAWHANSQLMFAGHVKARDFAETIMLVYSAKRRAEVAPGVGEQTDMVVIGPRLGDVVAVGPPLMQTLADTFKESREQAEKVRDDANTKINEFFKAPTGEASVHSQGDPALEARSSEDQGLLAAENAG
jgi:hypothetical protein